MKVTLATHGGMAAALQLGRAPTVVDDSLVAAARGDAPPPDRSRAVPDEAQYTITVDDGQSADVLQRSDTTMSPAFAALLAWLEEHAAS
jgi:ABC-type amino acid transport substrate-binding protein